MKIERRQTDDFVVNELPDGSKVMLDRRSETVFALNTTAGAAWDACGSAATLPEIAAKMERSLDAKVTEELAAAALLELEQKNLVKTTGVPVDASRRRFITQIGMAAVPLVAALTLSEQRAYAERANSGLIQGHGPAPHHPDHDHDHDHDNWPLRIYGQSEVHKLERLP